MKQDRKLNKMIMFASVLGVLAGIIVLVAGAGTAVFGFLKHEELDKIKELVFFINQEGLISLQKTLFDGLLKTEYLYLVLGSTIGGIGLLVLIFSILGIVWAKKLKVVRRRFILLVFNLIPLAIVGAVATYLVLEFDIIPELIKYVCYGVGGTFAVIGLFNLLGVICSRSEKFMSNDNGKYAFDNSASLRNARVEVNNNVKEAEYQPVNQEQNNASNFVYQEQRVQNAQQYQPMGQPNASMQQRPVQSRPMQPRPQQGAIPARPQQPNQMQARPAVGARPQMNNVAQSTARPVSQPNRAGAQPVRPMARPGQAPQQRPAGVRPQGAPVQAGGQRPALAQRKYCLGCGSLLNPGETICKVCGTKATK